MDYESCRFSELVRHAAREDPQAQALLIEEIRHSLRALLEYHGAKRAAVPDFPQQLLTRVRTDYGEFCDRDSEFGQWLDEILQREVNAACSS